MGNRKVVWEDRFKKADASYPISENLLHRATRKLWQNCGNCGRNRVSADRISAF